MHPTILTCGHSTGALAAYVELLRAHGVTRYVDVRLWPRSRRHPHFSSDVLSEALQASGISYVHEPALGGMREPRPDSPHGGWKKPFLRGYADHLDTREAREALERVLAWAAEPASRVAVACAERNPLDCHRQVLSDALVSLGARVLHVIDAGLPREHVPPPFARFEPGRVSWPPPGEAQGRLF